MGNSNQDTG